uniref:Isocitrate lyase/PEP mutase family protein n=1 Tax=Bosea sp. NBC_00436 TaxID=2969620 RepID=A0A9E7ZQJ2_9HYPH
MKAHVSRSPAFEQALGASRERAVLVPGAYDALSAKLIEEAGFPLIYVGSFAVAASAHGLPDVGVITLDDMTEAVRAIRSSVDLPVLADAEGGFLGPANIWRTVRQFETAGAAAIHIEDHAGDKHTNLPQYLVPLDLMLGRLRAAQDARTSDDFAIIARTDAIWATGDLQEAARRVEAFASIGIRHFFPTAATPSDLAFLRERIDGTYVTIDLPKVMDRSEWDGAADLVIDYDFSLRATAKALKHALNEFAVQREAAPLRALLETAEEFEARFGYNAYVERATTYTR